MYIIYINGLFPDINYYGCLSALAKPSEASGKGEEFFGGRKEQSCGVSHSGK